MQNLYVTKYGADVLNYNFADSIITDFDTETAEPINTLNLSKVYVITTGQTASASEMVINGLKPHMTVKVVGSNSHGKYVGSQTFYDIDRNKDTVKTHKWALQPIIVKIANSNGVSDYVTGFTPNISAEENMANLKPFGDLSEPLLKAALDNINGTQSAVIESSSISKWKAFGDSKDRNPHIKEMYLDKYMKIKL
jgi:C-terminal processing protease CtpA/Prc